MNKKEDNNHKFNIKDLKFINKRLIITVLLLIITIASGTLAWFTYRSDKSALVLTVGNIDDVRVILKPYHITGTLDPSDTYDGGVYTQVTGINDSEFDAQVKLKYKINQLSDALLDSGLKYTVLEFVYDEDDFANVIKVAWGNFSDIVDSNVYEVTVPANTTRHFKIYIWLDNSVDNTAAQGEILDVELTGTVEFESSDFGDNIYICNDSDKSISIYNDVICDGAICSYTRVDNSSVSETMQISSYDELKSNLTIDGIKSNCGSSYVTQIVDDDYDDGELFGYSCLDSSNDDCTISINSFEKTNIYDVVKISNVSWQGDNESWFLVEFGDFYLYSNNLGNITSVNITGENVPGGTLTANVTDMNSENTYSYQWYENDTNSITSGTLIDGATSSTLTLTEDYVDKYIYVVVTSVTTDFGTITYTDITDGKIVSNITTINDTRYTCDDETVEVIQEVVSGQPQTLTLKSITVYNITTCDGEICNYNKKNGLSLSGTVNIDLLKSDTDNIKGNCGEDYVIEHSTSGYDNSCTSVSTTDLCDMILTGYTVMLSPLTDYDGWYYGSDDSYYSYSKLVSIPVNDEMYTCDGNDSITIYSISTCNESICNYTAKNGTENQYGSELIGNLQSGLDPDSVRANCGDSYVTEYVFTEDSSEAMYSTEVGYNSGAYDYYNPGESLELVKITGYSGWYWYYYQDDDSWYYYIP